MFYILYRLLFNCCAVVWCRKCLSKCCIAIKSSFEANKWTISHWRRTWYDHVYLLVLHGTSKRKQLCPPPAPPSSLRAIKVTHLSISAWRWPALRFASPCQFYLFEPIFLLQCHTNTTNVKTKATLSRLVLICSGFKSLWLLFVWKEL